MLQTQTVEAGTLDLIKTLMHDAELSAFNLVGGTALSLMIGHRKSVDIDLFTNQDFDSEKLADYLSRQYPTEEVKTVKNGVFCFISDVKIDLIAHQYTILKPLNIQDDIRMLSLTDIGAMKINAIYNNGSRLKDFVDMYFLLERVPFLGLIKGFAEKYPDINRQMAQNALLYHQDINTSEKIEFLQRNISMEEMAHRFKMAIQNPALVFKQEEKNHLLQKREDIKSKNRKRGLGL